MADERIEDITGGELTALAAADKFVVLDKSDTTDDADGTAKYVEAATLGAWEYATGTDAATAMAVGVWYNVDMSGWTADRVYSLPTTAAVGDMIAVCITAGDDAYEMDLQTTSASNDTINGVDHDSTPWSRLFITGEVVVFKCVTANTAWVVVHDGRIPCKASMYLAADMTTSTAAVAKKVPLDTQVFDNSDIADPTTNKRVDLRRDGEYTVSCSARPYTATPSNGYYIVQIHVNGTLKHIGAFTINAQSSGGITSNVTAVLKISSGDYVEPFIVASNTNGGAEGDSTRTYLMISEVL